jgi:Bacterial dnaA protein helix-turn-helix
MEDELNAELKQKYHENKVSQKIQYIKRVVALYYGEHWNVYKRKTRKKEVVHIRHIALYLSKEMTIRGEISLTEIGKKFGGYNHATVLHAHRKIDGFLTYDNELRAEIEEIKELIVTRTLVSDDDDSMMKDYYFVDLNNTISMKLPNKKAVVLVGFSMKEAEMFKAAQKIKSRPRAHKNTGAYILELKNKK